MGTTSCCLSWLASLDASNWIDIIAIAINSVLAIWIINTIQNKIANKRILKDHFIDEFKELRNEYRSWLSNLYSDQVHPKRIVPWFKLMSIKINDLMDVCSEKYSIDRKMLDPYQIDLRELVTNCEEFTKQYKSDKTIVLSDATKNKIMKFQQEYSHLFNDVIVQINDSK